jgi:hypothetical protein
MMAIDRHKLTEQHTALEESAARLTAAVGSEVPDMEELARAKWQLGYRLAVHLAHEDRHVYPELKAHANPRIAKLAGLYEREMGDLDQRFRGYLAGWAPDRIVAEWPTYVRETRVILSLLAQRVAREEQELYPLLGQPG